MYYDGGRRAAKVTLQADQATSSYKRRNPTQKQYYGIYGQRANDFSI
jgi:hypothetical protein